MYFKWKDLSSTLIPQSLWLWVPSVSFRMPCRSAAVALWLLLPKAFILGGGRREGFQAWVPAVNFGMPYRSAAVAFWQPVAKSLIPPRVPGVSFGMPYMQKCCGSALIASGKSITVLASAGAQNGFRLWVPSVSFGMPYIDPAKLVALAPSRQFRNAEVLRRKVPCISLYKTRWRKVCAKLHASGAARLGKAIGRAGGYTGAAASPHEGKFFKANGKFKAQICRTSGWC